MYMLNILTSNINCYLLQNKPNLFDKKQFFAILILKFTRHIIITIENDLTLENHTRRLIIAGYNLTFFWS